MTTPLCCEICDGDVGTPGMVLARWHGIDVCLDCLSAKEEMERADGQGALRPVMDDPPLESGSVGPRHW